MSNTIYKEKRTFTDKNGVALDYWAIFMLMDINGETVKVCLKLVDSGTIKKIALAEIPLYSN